MTRGIPHPRVPRKALSPSELWAKEAAAAKRRASEDLLAAQLRAYGLPEPEREFRFHPDRMWRVDFAWPAWKIAVEVEGITFAGGRHQRPAGFEKDSEKYNALASAGWRLFRYTPARVKRGFAVVELRVELERASRAARWAR